MAPHEEMDVIIVLAQNNPPAPAPAPRRPRPRPRRRIMNSNHFICRTKNYATPALHQDCTANYSLIRSSGVECLHNDGDLASDVICQTTQPIIFSYQQLPGQQNIRGGT
ncbi:hypothetical protein JYU34_019068 [Plutella xylostella]|uniref:Uncharacterized protein n=1 Tax=Plutella xylostella TaxID=51655 RepID=A0ABQ7PZX6_PLUXY|nr:hypothetical protein JYU34_019068 [Plutella xylostella]